MANDRVVRIVLVGDSKNAVRALRETADASEQATSKIEEHGHRQVASMEMARSGSHRLATGLGVMAGALGLGTYAIMDSVKAGMALQEQQSQLSAALRSTGAYSTQSFNQMSLAAENMASRGGFATQENIQALTQFTRVTGSATAATNLLGLATNVARGSHKDLLQVTKALALAEQGRTTGLSRLGIVLPKGATPQQAMAILQQRYGGATAAFSNSTAGGLSNLKQSFDVLKERLGQAFLPLVRVVTRTLSGAMPMISRVLTAIAVPLQAALGKLLPPLMSVLQALIPPLLAMATPIINAIQTVMPAILGVIRSVMPIFTRALNILLPPLIHVFNTIVPIIAGVFARIGPPLMAALATVLTALAPVIVKFVQVLAPIFPMLATAISKILPPLATAIASLMPPLTTALVTLLPPFVKAFDLLVPPLTTALVALLSPIKLLSGAINSITGIFGGGPADSAKGRSHLAQNAHSHGLATAFGRPVPLNSVTPSMSNNSGQAHSGDSVFHAHIHVGTREVAEEIMRYSRRQVALS